MAHDNRPRECCSRHIFARDGCDVIVLRPAGLDPISALLIERPGQGVTLRAIPCVLVHGQNPLFTVVRGAWTMDDCGGGAWGESLAALRDSPHLASPQAGVKPFANLSPPMPVHLPPTDDDPGMAFDSSCRRRALAASSLSWISEALIWSSNWPFSTWSAISTGRSDKCARAREGPRAKETIHIGAQSDPYHDWPLYAAAGCGNTRKSRQSPFRFSKLSESPFPIDRRTARWETRIRTGSGRLPTSPRPP